MILLKENIHVSDCWRVDSDMAAAAAYRGGYGRDLPLGGAWTHVDMSLLPCGRPNGLTSVGDCEAEGDD